MKNALILLAGGLGKRAGFKEPKQFLKIGNTNLLEYFLSNLDEKLFDIVIIAIMSKKISADVKLIQKKYKNLNLFILGEGEERKNLENKIKKLNLSKKIFLVGHKKNIYDYLKKSKIFVLSSLWEDPGFVLLEAGYLNKIIFSSDCPSGPIEILNNGENGFLYKSNSTDSFVENFDKLINCNKTEIYKKKLKLKIKCKEFTLLNHYQKLKIILN